MHKHKEQFMYKTQTHLQRHQHRLYIFKYYIIYIIKIFYYIYFETYILYFMNVQLVVSSNRLNSLQMQL